MKLLHWFPLNNTFEDKGANNNTELQIYKNKAINFTTIGKLGLAPTFTSTRDEALLIDNKINKTDINISFWFKINEINITNSNSFICCRTTPFLGLLIVVYNKKLVIDPIVSSKNRWETNYIVKPNEWTHLSINFDNNKVSYFINGIFQEQKNINMNIGGLSNKIIIGQTSNTNDIPANANILNGSIQDVRIYDEPLSVKQIRDLAKAEVVNNNFKELQSDDETNVYGELAGFFSKNTTELKDKNIQLTINNHSFTNSFWIKLTDRTLKLFNKTVDVFNIGKKLNLSLRLNKLGDIIYGTHDEFITSNKALEPKKWYLITTKYDKVYNTIYLYINGELQHSLRLTKLLQVDDYILTLRNKELECYLSRYKLNAKLFSDEEIQEEYTNVASVDNKNNIEASEFIEYQDNRIVTTPKSDVVYLKNLAKDKPPINIIRLYAANNYKEYKGYNKFDIRTLKSETKNGMAINMNASAQWVNFSGDATTETEFNTQNHPLIKITPGKTKLLSYYIKNSLSTTYNPETNLFIKNPINGTKNQIILSDFYRIPDYFIKKDIEDTTPFETNEIGFTLNPKSKMWSFMTRVMITDSDETEWEPYTENKSAPRLNWEIPIQNVGYKDNLLLNVGSRENILFKMSPYIKIENNQFIMNPKTQGYILFNLFVEKGKIYKIGFKKLNQSNSDYFATIEGYLNGKAQVNLSIYSIQTLETDKLYTKTFTSPITGVGYLSLSSNQKDTNINFQIWVAEEKDFNDFTMPLVQNEQARLIGSSLDLQSIEEIKDYIYYNQTDKKWYVKKYIQKYQLTGNEDWQIETDSGINDNRRITFRNNSYIKDSKYFEDNQTVISNRLINRNEYDEIIEDQIKIVNESGKGEIITTYKSTINDVNTLKAFLKANPTYIYYVQKEPTDIEITNANLLSDLNKLWLSLSTLNKDTYLQLYPSTWSQVENILPSTSLQVEYNQQNDNTNANQKIIETSQILANEFIETENTAKISADNKYIIANEIIEY